MQALGHSLVSKTDPAPPSAGGHTAQPGQNKPVVRIRAKERRAGIRSCEFELWAQCVHQRWASLSNISFFEIKKKIFKSQSICFRPMTFKNNVIEAYLHAILLTFSCVQFQDFK